MSTLRFFRGDLEVDVNIGRTDTLPVQGVKAITYIATCPDKQVVLSVLCSLLNTVSTSILELYGRLLISHLDYQIQPSLMADAV